MAEPLNIRKFGATCDGKTDDLPALIAAATAAKAESRPIVVPAYSVLALSDVATLDSVEMYGESDPAGTPLATIYSLNPMRAAIFLRGSAPSIHNLIFDGVAPTVRGNTRESCRVVARDAVDFAVNSLRIVRSAAVGVRVDNSSGHIFANRISDTLADSIHLTDRAFSVMIEDNLTERSGDDGIACVSYNDSPDWVRDIVARNNRILDNKGGRGMSVVGGKNIRYENNFISGNPHAAGLYIAVEDNEKFKTKAVDNVLALRNTVVDCGNVGMGHYAVMVFSNTADRLLTNVTLDHCNVTQNDGQRGGVRVQPANCRNVKFLQNVVVAKTPFTIDPVNTTITPYTEGAVGVQ